MDLRPAEIAMRQFSRTLFGADPAEVRRFLAEAAATLERVNAEVAQVILDRTALQSTLKMTTAEVEVLRKQLAEAHEKLAAYQGQESLLARAFLNAQKAAEELTRDSKAQAERTIAEANAAAEETIQSARNEAADLLRATRTRAQLAIEATDRAAAMRFAEVKIEIERVAEEARRTAAEVRRAARQQVEELIAHLEAFLATREEWSRHLDALARRHADSLDVMGRMHAEVAEVILPALRGMMRTLTEKEGGPAGPSVGPVASDARAPAVGPAPMAPAEPAAPSRRAEVLRSPAASDGKGVPATTLRAAGEIVVSPIHSYLQATKLVTAVARIKGVRRARLRTFAKGSVIIDVTTEGGTFAGLEPRLIDGFPLDVVEATDRRLVLRLIPNGGPRAHPDEGLLRR
jgi:cell division septum initiation protein DivIVA